MCFKNLFLIAVVMIQSLKVFCLFFYKLVFLSIFNEKTYLNSLKKTTKLVCFKLLLSKREHDIRDIQ